MIWTNHPDEPWVGQTIHKPKENQQKQAKTTHGRREAPPSPAEGGACDFGLFLLMFLRFVHGLAHPGLIRMICPNHLDIPPSSCLGHESEQSGIYLFDGAPGCIAQFCQVPFASGWAKTCADVMDKTCSTQLQENTRGYVDLKL